MTDPKKFFIVPKVLLGFALGAVVVALLGQLYAFLNPGYSNILIEPDRVIGWKFAPNIEFIHTGDHWYANELSVRHRTNSLGFVAPERPMVKPADTARIVLMGDSFVEALQVPRERSAAGVLERLMNRWVSSGAKPYHNAEVLNFGLSNISVGQYLLVWEEYAAKFSPDYVFIFLSGMQMERTTQRQADSGTVIGRPSFELVNGELVRHPPENYESAVKTFQEQIRERGGRTKKREQKIWIVDWIKGGDMARFIKGLFPQRLRLALKQLVADDTIQPFLPSLKEKVFGFMKPAQTKTPQEAPPKVHPQLEMSEDVLAVNLRVIEELNKQVARSGGKLIIVDASYYFWFAGANEVLPQRIKDFSENNKIPYIPLYEDLLATDRNNMWARFPHSHHFNEHGNAIFANRMFEWIKTESK